MNTLLDKGIILPSGEINKDKINLVAGEIMQPFAEMVWLTMGGDMETINRLTDILVSMNTPADRGKLLKIIKLLYGLVVFRGSRADGRRPGRTRLLPVVLLHIFHPTTFYRSPFLFGYDYTVLTVIEHVIL